MATIERVAREVSAAFEGRTRENGEAFRCIRDGGRLGWVPYQGPCEVAGEVWREYRHRPEVRRAFRACRRWLGGPLRMLVTVTASDRAETEDTCEVYGWRAALTAARAMRTELPEGWRRPRVTVLDAVLYRAALRSAGMED